MSYLFVPSEERVNAITNTVSSKFEFVDNIKTSVNSLKSIITNVEGSPRLSLHLNSTKYTPESDFTIIDFSFYEPYKAFGDLILTGFVYIFFLWRIFIHLPDIIHGLSGSADLSQMMSEIDRYNENGIGRSSGKKLLQGKT